MQRIGRDGRGAAAGGSEPRAPESALPRFCSLL